MSFKSVEEIDREITRLDKQVESGTLRLVDERKAVTDISNLRKQRKGFAELEETQRTINNLKNQIAELRKTLDHPESKALSEKYAEIQKELDAIKAEQDEASKNLNSLRDERSSLQNEQRQKFNAIRDLKKSHFDARRAYKQYEDEQWKIRRERQKAQRDAIEHEKKKKVADRKLEEASVPAYTDEILTAQALIRHFNPTYDFAALGLDDDKKGDTGAFRAQIGRTVDDSDIKGVKVLKKEDREEDYFVGTGGKKGKKGKKGSSNNSPTPGTPSSEGTKINLNIGVIEDFAKLKIDPPMNPTDVPAVTEKLAANITDWKKNQASKTEEVSLVVSLSLDHSLPLKYRIANSMQNVKKAQADIARLNGETESKTNGTAKEANGVDGTEQKADKEANGASTKA